MDSRYHCRPLILLGLITALLLVACGGQTRVVVVTQAPENVASAPTTAPVPTSAPTTAPVTTAVPVAAATDGPAALSTAADVKSEYKPNEIVEQARAFTMHVIGVFGQDALRLNAALGAGTGVLYDEKNGYIVTNAHVVTGASRLQVSLPKQAAGLPVRVVGVAPCDDLAVVQLTGAVPPDAKAAKLDTTELQQQQDIVVAGYPNSFNFTDDLTSGSGRVSGTNVRIETPFSPLSSVTEISAPINPGNSGGPLLDMSGNVVGINSAGSTQEQNRNFSISMPYAKRIIDQLQQGKNLNYLGLNLLQNQFPDFYGRNDGLAVIGIATGSPGDRAGMKPTDLVVNIEGEPATIQSFCGALATRGDGQQVRLDVFRPATKQQLECRVTIGQMSGDRRAHNCQVVGGTQGSTNGGQGTGSDDEPAPEPTATPEPQEAPEEEPDEDTGGPDTTTLVTSNFNDGKAGDWDTFKSEGYSAQVRGGKYVIGLGKGNVAYSYPEKVKSLANGAVASEVTLRGNGQAGLMARYREGNQPALYLCYIDPSGFAGCAKYANGKATNFLGPKRVASIKPRGANQLVIAVAGNSVYFEVNEKKVGEVKDSTVKQAGAWGLYAYTQEGNFEAAFDNIAIIKVK